MPDWWDRLWGKPPREQRMENDEGADEVAGLRRGLEARVAHERRLIGELRRIEGELRKDAQ